MVNGQMKCLGSIQHLKHKYGHGYTISVILKSIDKTLSVHQYLRETIPGCTLCDTRYRTLTFEIKDLGEGLGAVFRVLEGLVMTGDVEDYSVSQNTLDNVSCCLLPIYELHREKPVLGVSDQDTNRAVQ